MARPDERGRALLLATRDAAGVTPASLEPGASCSLHRAGRRRARSPAWSSRAAAAPGDRDDENVPVVPTPTGRRARRGRRRPVRVDAEQRSAELVRRAAAGTSHLLYTRSPGGAAGDRRAGRALPRAGRARGDRPRAWTPTGSRRSSSWRAPGGPRRARRAGSRAPPGSRRSSPRPATNLLGDAGRPRPQPAATRAGWTARCGEGNLPAGRGAQPRAAARRRPLRPRQGAGRHRALPEARAGALRPRGPRVRLLPHGHGQPGERARARSAAAGAPTPSCTSTPRRGVTPSRLREARLVRRRLLQLLLEARRGDGDHAASPAPTRPG